MTNNISKRRITIKIISLIVVACFYASTISWAMPDLSSRLNAQNIQIQSMFRPIVGNASWEYLTTLNSEKEFILRMVARDMPFTDINIALDEWVLNDKDSKDSRVLNVLASQRTKDGELLIFLEIINGRDKGINFVLAVPQKGINAIKQGKTSYKHRVLACNVPVSGMVDGFSIQEKLPREYKEFPREPVATMFRGYEAVVESISPKFEDLKKIFKRMAEIKTEDKGEYMPPTMYLPMISFDADATSKQGHVVFTSLDSGILPEEIFNAVTRAEVNGLVQVERLVNISHFYKAAVDTGIDPKEYIFNVFIENTFLTVFEKKTYDTIHSISGDQGEPDIPAGSLMGKFLESKSDPIRVEGEELKGTIKGVKTGQIIDLGEDGARRAKQAEVEAAIKRVEESIDAIPYNDGRKIFLKEVLQSFKGNPPKDIFLANQGKNGFFGIAIPGLMVLDADDGIIKNPVAFLHEIFEYSKYFDDTLMARTRNFLLGGQVVDGWLEAKKNKYIEELGGDISVEALKEISSHYVIRAFVRQVFPEGDMALGHSIYDLQKPSREKSVREINVDTNIAEYGAKAFLALLDKLEGEDRRHAAETLMVTYAGTSPESHSFKDLEDKQAFIQAVESDPNFIYVKFKGNVGSVVNVTAAKRVIENHPEYFPKEAAIDTERWLRENSAGWTSYLWAADYPSEYGEINHIRHGLLSGFPINAVKKFKYRVEGLIDKLESRNQALRDTSPSQAISEEGMVILRRNYTFCGAHPGVHAKAAEILRKKGKGLLSPEEVQVLIDEYPIGSVAVPGFFSYGKSDRKRVTELERIFAHFSSKLGDLDVLEGERDSIRRFKLSEKIEEVYFREFTEQDKLVYIIAKRDSLIVDEETGAIMPVTPLEDMIGDIDKLDVTVVRKIADKYGLNPLKLINYITKDSGTGQIGKDYDVREVVPFDGGLKVSAYDREEGEEITLEIEADNLGHLSIEVLSGILGAADQKYNLVVDRILKKFPRNEVDMYVMQEDPHKDLFGLANRANTLIAVHHSVFNEAAQFHEICEYVGEKDRSIISMLEKELDAEAKGWFTNHEEKYRKIGKTEFFEKNRNHYVIRAFTRMVFAPHDRSLTKEIKKSARPGLPTRPKLNTQVKTPAVYVMFGSLYLVAQGAFYLLLSEHASIPFFISTGSFSLLFAFLVSRKVVSYLVSQEAMRISEGKEVSLNDLREFVKDRLPEVNIRERRYNPVIWAKTFFGEAKRNWYHKNYLYLLVDVFIIICFQKVPSAMRQYNNDGSLKEVLITHKGWTPLEPIALFWIAGLVAGVDFPAGLDLIVPVFMLTAVICSVIVRSGMYLPHEWFHAYQFVLEEFARREGRINQLEAFQHRADTKHESIVKFDRVPVTEEVLQEVEADIEKIIADDFDAGKMGDILDGMIAYDNGEVILTAKGKDYVGNFPREHRRKIERKMLKPWKTLVDAAREIEERQAVSITVKTTTYEEDEKNIKSLSRASRGLIAVVKKNKAIDSPVDISIDVSLISEDEKLFDKNIETLADLILQYKDMENINFVFESFPKLGEFSKAEKRVVDVRAESVLQKVKQAVLSRAVFFSGDIDAEKFVSERIANVTRSAEESEQPVNVTLLPKEWLVWARDNKVELDENMYPVALEDHAVNDKAMLINFEAAFVVGVSKAALALAKRKVDKKEKGADSEYLQLRKDLVVKLNDLYKLIRDDVVIKEDTLIYMVDSSSLHRINRAIDLVLPPAARRMIDEIKRLHDFHQLHLQAA